MRLELELIQSHMAQKPMLRGEVGCACVAREVSVEKGGMGAHGYDFCAAIYDIFHLLPTPLSGGIGSRQ